MTTPIRTLIVDDEPLARNHLRSMLANDDEIEIVGEYGSGSEAVEAIRRDEPDLVQRAIRGLPAQFRFERPLGARAVRLERFALEIHPRAITIERLLQCRHDDPREPMFER